MVQDKAVKKYFPLIRALLIMGVITFIIQLVVNYVTEHSIVPNFYDLRVTSVVIFAFVLEGFRVCLGLSLFKWVDKRKLSDFGLKFKKKDVATTLLSLLIIFALVIIFIFVTKQTKMATWNFRYMQEIVPIYLFQAILVRGMCVGMGEEFLYRGYLFKTLDSYQKAIQYGVNILIFVSIHFLGASFNFMWLIELIIATFLFLYVYDVTGSIWPGVIIHGAVDLISPLTSWNLKGVSLTRLYWHGKYSFVEANMVLFVTINIVLIIVFWFFYGRKSEKGKIQGVTNEGFDN